MNDNALIADIEGYASVFNARDLNGDVIAPGAFIKSLRAKPAIRMLYQHAADAPIGRWTSVREESRGLYVAGVILLSSPRAREVHALLAGGALDGLSIGYQTVKAKKTPGGRRILEAALWEVSIVTFPMAVDARVIHVGAPRLENPGAVHATDSADVSPLTQPKRRALASPPTSARQFAETLRDAASLLSA